MNSVDNIEPARWVSRVAAVLLLLATGLHAQADYPLRDAVECHPRNGLPNLLAKVAAGRN